MDWTQKTKDYQHSAVSCQVKYRFIDERTLAARLGFMLFCKGGLVRDRGGSTRKDISVILHATIRLDPGPGNKAGKCGATCGHQHYRAQCPLECVNRLLVNVGLSGHHSV